MEYTNPVGLLNPRNTREHGACPRSFSLTFDEAGATQFERITAAHLRERLAIVLEGEVTSAPVIQTRIAGGRAQITLGGGRDRERMFREAKDLAVVLQNGSLPAPIRILEEQPGAPGRTD